MLSPDELKLIKKCFLFNNCKARDFERFLADEECFVSSFSKGESISGNDKNEKRLGIMLLGKASALCTDSSKSSIKTFGAGDIFGAASVFSSAKGEPFSKMKALNNCRVFFITKRGVEKLIRLNPECALEYISFLSDRVAFLNRRISTFTSKEAVCRVAKYLAENANENSVCKNINFSALAKSLDISRASLYRAKSELIELKAIAVDKKDVIVLDREALKKFS